MRRAPDMSRTCRPVFLQRATQDGGRVNYPTSKYVFFSYRERSMYVCEPSNGSSKGRGTVDLRSLPVRTRARERGPNPKRGVRSFDADTLGQQTRE